MYDPKKPVDWKGVQARYKDMMAELRAQKESDEWEERTERNEGGRIDDK